MSPFTLVEDDRISHPVYAATAESVKESIGHPPCECVDCQNGFYTIKEQENPGLSYRCRLSDEDAESRVLAAVGKIRDGREKLTEQLNVFADVLMSRWNKRSQANREALLKEAAPDLEERQWLVPRYTYLRERLYVHARSQRRRRQLLLPWLNVEVLKSNPAVLFALLHYRTAYSPQQWAAFDSGQLTLSWAAGFLDVDFSAKCVVMYGQRYGSLVDWFTSTTKSGLDQKLRRIIDATEGLRHIHQNGIVHADFGCSNMILIEDRVKIIDFGGCSIDGSEAIAGYNWYNRRGSTSPNLQTDIFAYGCAVFEILTGNPPYHEFEECAERDRQVQYLYAEGRFPTVQQLPLCDLILGCWHGTFSSMDEVQQFLDAACSGYKGTTCAESTIAHLVTKMLSCFRLRQTENARGNVKG